MGTQFRVTVYATDIVKAQAAIRAAFARAHDLNHKLSDYLPDSELNQLKPGRNPVSDDLYKVLAYSQQVARESNGNFDVTLGPLIRLWRTARQTATLPEPKAVRQAKARSGYKNLNLPAPNTVELKKAGMQLDLGAIAKGYAADQMLKNLHDAGFPIALIAASGDLAIGDPPPGRPGWTVELGATGETRDLHNCGVSTSGDESQYVVINGQRYSHIVNPKTGLGLHKTGMVTVIAPTAMESDAWSTALSVSGQRGLKVRGVTKGKD
ncbi:FAD:protein FMN transferase [Bryobacterales bacterium F-183]|nr:FAD:protein FMN transferase [Bryobacterales bacterium F-183]